jgi:uncharacterized repeat protein (TIGR02543 family)
MWVLSNGKYAKLPVPTLTGYTFLGWYDAPGGVGKQYAEGANVTLTGDATLHAYWIPNSYQVSLDGNGGSVNGDSRITVTYEGAYPTLPDASRTGYSFLGWYTAQVGGAKINEGAQVKTAENHTLYAQWRIYSGGSGGGNGNTGNVNNGSNVINNNVSSGDKSSSENSAEQYKLIFNPNGGKVSSKNKTVTNGSTIGKTPVPTRKGYGFLGWYTKKTGGSKVSSNTKVSLTRDRTVYAHWGKKYTIQFNANGGKVSKKKKTVTKGLAFGSLPKPKRSGYAFAGWYAKKAGGSKITADKIVKIKKATTYYAHWKKNKKK